MNMHTRMVPALTPAPSTSAASATGPLHDAHGRRKRKLRLSLTDRCNLRCAYCMPEKPHWLPQPHLLRQEELLHLARLFVQQLGIEEIRLTGGEPLLRPDLPDIIRALNDLRPHGLRRIALTSNGIALPHHASALRDAGLDDLNISLDALDAPVFKRLTGGQVQRVLHGIQAAHDAGIALKLNCVLLRGHNEDQALPLLHWAMERNLPLRFIEFMPLDARGGWDRQCVVSEDDLLAQLRPHHHLLAEPHTGDPAHYYRVDGHYRLGMISTVSRPFCQHCDRVRLSANGELYACLFSAAGINLKTLLRDGADDAHLLRHIHHHIWHKDIGYAARPGYVARPITMHLLGG